MGGVSKKCALRSRKTCRFGNQKCAFRHNKRRALDLWRGRRIAQSRLHTFDEMGRKKATALNDTLDVARMIFVKTKRATNTTRRFTNSALGIITWSTANGPKLRECFLPTPRPANIWCSEEVFFFYVPRCVFDRGGNRTNPNFVIWCVFDSKICISPQQKGAPRAARPLYNTNIK